MAYIRLENLSKFRDGYSYCHVYELIIDGVWIVDWIYWPL
jgi:hypothetical protein